MDDPLEVRLDGVKPQVSVRIRASFADDHGQTWQSEATFVADKTGVVDLATAIPTDGAWAEPDPYGLLWSMRAVTGQPASYAQVFTGSLRPLIVTLTALLDGEAAAQVQLERRFAAEGVRCSEWRDGDLVANLFLPAGDGPWDATLVLEGVFGGFIWANEVAALLASRGRAALAIAYFDWRGRYGLPTSITEIPLEYFRGAIERLQAHPQVRLEDLAAVGISKGSELVLLLASTYPQIRRVVAKVPTAYVWEAVRRDPSAPARSSWTLDQRPLSYAAFAADDEFYRTLDKTRLLQFHERALQDTEALQSARIRVEQTEAQMLLLSIAEDRTWPSTLMCKQIVKTMHESGKARLVTHIVIEGRHHGLSPPGLPINSVDDPAVNARGELRSWTATLTHLGLKPPALRIPK
ncbi:MAG: acyl-CoA thioesterase/BAAT N-terminal domain-containing protein [Egibacteraceae bacterium]